MLHVDQREFARDARPFGCDASSAGPAMAAAGIGVFQLDTHSGLATWDAVISAILGFPPEPRHEPSPLPIHPDDQAEVARRLERNIRGEGERDIDVRIIRPSGEIRWVRSTTRPPAERADERRWVVGIVTDITDRKLAELALVESQRQLATLIDNLPGIAYRCSTEAPWRMSFISEGVEKLTGYSAADFTEGGLGWAELIHTDGGEVGAEVAAAIAERRAFSFTYRIRTRSGEMRWVFEQGRAIYGEDGAPLFLEGFIGDVTERKRSEAEALGSYQRLGSVLEGTLDCVYSMDRDFRITYMNENARRQFGRPKLLGKRIREILPGSEASEFAECYRRVMETRRSESIEGFFAPDDAWYEAHVTPSDDGITIFYRDITARKKAEQALREATEKAHSILDSVPHIIWSADAEGRLDYLSNQWRGRMRGATGSMLGHDWHEAVHPEDLPQVMAQWQRSLASGCPFEVEMRVRQDESYRWMLVKAAAEREDSGVISRWYGTCTDIHERVLAQQGLSKTQAFLERLIEASPDNVMLLDDEGRLLFANEAAQKSLGVRTGEPLAGRQWAGFAARPARAAARNALLEARAGRPARFTGELALPGQSRRWWDVIVTPLPEEGAATPNLLVISRDVTLQKEAEERAQWSANHDFLTRLPNRHYLQQRLDALLGGRAGGGAAFALLLLDVDQFKAVNDNLGHDAGDALLCAIGDRLKSAARAEDVVARLGGDEFAVLLEGAAAPADVEAAIARIEEKLAEPCLHHGKPIDCHASIGASLYPLQGRERAELLKQADIALYAAKAAGRGCWKLYDPSLRAEGQRRQNMHALARTALAEDLIVPHYQPKVDLRSGALAGFEALLRWAAPGRPVQSPDTIAAAFEDLSLATQISDRMIARVLADIAGWLDAGIAFESVAINAAAAEFRRGDFADRLLERIAKFGIAPGLIQIEVTETVFLGRGAEHVERCLQALSAGGVRIALDDFGTGYASLSHLKQFPVDLIKIDRSFVAGVLGDADDRAIVDAVIKLGHSLGIDVVAEGIETAPQREAILALGCAYGQGWLFGRPVPAAQLAAAARTIAEAAERKAA